MPPLRSIKQPAAIASFCSLGGVERKGKGSHRIVKMPNGRALSIPAGTLKVGLLLNLIRVAEITVEEFEEKL